MGRAASFPMWFPRPTPLSFPNCISIGSAVFGQVRAGNPLQWAAPSPPQNFPFAGDMDPHLIHGSLD